MSNIYMRTGVCSANKNQKQGVYEANDITLAAQLPNKRVILSGAACSVVEGSSHGMTA